MAHRVQYAADHGRRSASGPGPAVLDLDVERPSDRADRVIDPRPARSRPGRTAGALLLVVIVGATVVASSGDAGPDAAPQPAAVPVVLDGAALLAPAAIPTRAVVDSPWRGVVERHLADPDDLVPDRVHVLGFGGEAPDGVPVAALAVVDATKRAQVVGDGDLRPGPLGAPVRMLGPATGLALRTLEWDAGAFGLSLTTVGLTPSEGLAVGAAITLPTGPALLHGRAPQIRAEVLAAHRMGVSFMASGPATTVGNPLIGQSGGDAVEAYLYRSGGPLPGAVLLAVVADRVVTAAMWNRVLGAAAAVEDHGIAGIVSAAATSTLEGSLVGTRVTGRTRLVLDHERGATIELASDTLGLDDLVALARVADLDLLAALAVG